VIVTSKFTCQVLGVKHVVDNVDREVLYLRDRLVRVALLPAHYSLLLPLVMTQSHLLFLVELVSVFLARITIRRLAKVIAACKYPLMNALIAKVFKVARVHLLFLLLLLLSLLC